MYARTFSFHVLFSYPPTIGIPISKLCNVPPQDLLWKWEAIKFKGDSLLCASEDQTFNVDSIAAIKAQLTRDLKEGSKRKPPARPNQFVFPANLQWSTHIKIAC